MTEDDPREPKHAIIIIHAHDFCIGCAARLFERLKGILTTGKEEVHIQLLGVGIEELEPPSLPKERGH